MKIRTWGTSILLLVGALVIAWLMVATKPQPRTGTPATVSPMVMVEPVHTGEAAIVLRALGIVRPVQEVLVRPRVTGTVLSLHERLQPGEHVAANEVLLQLDPMDYELELRRKESAVAQAKANLELEMGQQKVARAELEQIRRTLPSAGTGNMALARREPHLAQVQAALAAAEADRDAATVNLERTQIRAPFNALVTARSVSPGSQAGTGDVLATLVGTDTYWIEAMVPLDRMSNLFRAGRELPVTVRLSDGQERRGRFERSTGTLDSASRMGLVLIAVDDPLGIKDIGLPHLVLNDQVRVEIDLGAQAGVIVLPRAALRGGDMVWVVKDGSLDIRKVDILWRDTDEVYVTRGLQAGEQVILSDLSAPIQGMRLRTPGPVVVARDPEGAVETGEVTP